MKRSQFWALIAAIYCAPHVDRWLALTLGVVAVVLMIGAALSEPSHG